MYVCCFYTYILRAILTNLTKIKNSNARTRTVTIGHIHVIAALSATPTSSSSSALSSDCFALKMFFGNPIQSYMTDDDSPSFPAGSSSEGSHSWPPPTSNAFSPQFPTFTASNDVFLPQNDSSRTHNHLMMNPNHFQTTNAANFFPIIASASHVDLVASNNPVYINLLQSYNTLFEQYRQLQMSFTQAPFSTSNASHASSARSLSSLSASTSSATTEIINKTTFPSIRFWNRDSFNKSQNEKKTATMNMKPGARGGARAAKNINAMAQYVEHEDGTIATGQEVKEMRRTQRSIFREIRTNFPDQLPASWGGASLAVITYHREQMYKAHPCLRLCTADWKVRLLATDAYSSWYGKAVKNKRNADASSDEDEDDEDDEDDKDDEDDEDDDTEAGRQRSARPRSSAPPRSSASSASAASSSAAFHAAGPSSKRKSTFLPSQQAKRAKPTSPDPGSSAQQPGTPSGTPNPTSASSTSNSSHSDSSQTVPPPTTPPAAGSLITEQSSLSSAPPLSSATPPVYLTQPAVPPKSPASKHIPSSNANNSSSSPALLSAAAANARDGVQAPQADRPTPLAPAKETMPILTEFDIVNPLETEYGPPSGPTQRRDAASSIATTSKAPKQNKKRVTKSLSPE
ncbi:hypothetical protein R3P38DRAFT_3182816 [Favolaschia claudopus]|uniref:Uncharacterized protein n=1 Tax=Favolaschia claudopus TaxID=2862362 RepID=A0AAW0CEW2_9AGAR